MAKSNKIKVHENVISVIILHDNDYISHTDMTNSFSGGSGLIGKWISNKNTLEYLSIWEKINNPKFNYPEFEVIEKEAGTNRFIMSAGQWLKRTNALGMVVKAGRYGGTYAHKDIAFHFAMWLNPEFQIYLVNEFQRLKLEESNRSKLNWNLQRVLAKINYHIHTDAIKENLIPKEISNTEASIIYANEADVLNMASFSKTAAQWRKENPKSKGNIRDQATLEQLVVLTNLESLNAVLIQQGLSQKDWLLQLNKTAIHQLKTLLNNKSMKRLNQPTEM